MASVVLVVFALQPARAHPFFWPNSPLRLSGLPVDPGAGKRLQAAAAALQKQAWDEALPILQAFLDAPECVFAADGEFPRAYCAQTEARRLLAGLPTAGVKAYEERYGKAARERLKEATDRDQLKVYGEVALRYPASEAAAEALLVLANEALEHGDPVLAAACYGKLFQQKTRAEQLSALTLYRATVTFRKSGDLAQAEAVWKQLTAKLGEGVLTINGRELNAAALARELDKAAPIHAGLKEWLVYRGNANRTGQGLGAGSFKSAPAWRQSTTLAPESGSGDARTWAEDLINNGTRQVEAKGWPAIPAFQPLVTNGQVICRTYNGVYATYLEDHEIQIVVGGERIVEKKKPGDHAWWSNSDGGVLSIVRDPNKKGVLDSWRAQYSSLGTANAIFENSLIGTLSSDGKRVYAIDDPVIPPHPQSVLQFRLGWGGQMNFGALQKQVVDRNTLKAFNIELGGPLRWELGGDHDPYADGTKDSFFLGPPLPLGDKLYVLNEKDGALRLVCLRPKDTNTDRSPPAPDLLWVQTLANMKDKFNLDFNRRLHAAHLIYSDGLLVCPTNAGRLIAVDLLAHELVWAHQYAEPAPLPPEPKKIRQIGFNPNQQVQYLLNEWKATAPAISDGKVVFAAPDSQAIHCLNLGDGRQVWKQPRAADDLYFAGVFSGKVLIVGKSAVRALNLADGKEAWKLDAVKSSGQGVASGDVYYLPVAATEELKKPAVLALSITKGTVVRAMALEKVPGNLVLADGLLLSQSIDALTAYSPAKE
jgi:outer membrane protein assembly factor BamB